jgi:hypothetical protein
MWPARHSLIGDRPLVEALETGDQQKRAYGIPIGTLPVSSARPG